LIVAAEAVGDLRDGQAFGVAEVTRERDGAAALGDTVIRHRRWSGAHTVQVLANADPLPAPHRTFADAATNATAPTEALA
jgi:hypothetical protein